MKTYYVKTLHRLCIVIVVLTISACGNSDIPTDSRTESFLIESPKSQQALIAALKERNVDYRVDDDQQVWFSPTDRNKVHSIANQVMQSAKPTRESFKYTDPRYTDMLIDELREKRIPFKLEIKNSEKYIVVEEKDADLWRPVRDRVDALYRKNIVETVTEGSGGAESKQ